MTLEIHTYILGPIGNNTYLIADPDARLAAVIDPSFDPSPLIEDVRQNDWTLAAIWLTHAHFDHIAGAQALLDAFGPDLPLALHPDDLALWNQGGGAPYFGVSFTPAPPPQALLQHGQALPLGAETFEVLHTPGHTRGQVVFSNRARSVAFVGDLIFQNSVGRTDLPGGSSRDLLDSIRRHILTLPLDTRLLSGHGPGTTVRSELLTNPYLG
jgi:glyoxylase-like metal-dependent hydrolase (beta-lactamase superfamily II)